MDPHQFAPHRLNRVLQPLCLAHGQVVVARRVHECVQAHAVCATLAQAAHGRYGGASRKQEPAVVEGAPGREETQWQVGTVGVGLALM